MGYHRVVLRGVVAAAIAITGCRSNAFVFDDAFVAVDAPPHAGAGPGGGTLDELRFAVVGDTRPSVLDDTAHYPAEIARRIWTAVEAERPHPGFAVTTGDYMFASTQGHEQSPQLDLYLAARASYAGVVYPAYGNHECTGDTSSNCGPGGGDGEPANYRVFVDRMLAPIGEARTYYVERFAASDGSWSAKFVFVAPNAWDDRQAAWLDAVLAQPTTYTFVVRHEPHDATSAPGVEPSAQILAKHPLTLLVVGHAHTYQHNPAFREVVVGNGGAPLTSQIDYGYAVIFRRADGSLDVTAYDFASRAVIDHFAITADGAGT